VVRGTISKAEREVRFSYRVGEVELGDLDFSEFFFRHEMLIEKAAEHQKELMVSAAFVGWQMGSGKKDQSFQSYLKQMGLSEKETELTIEEKALNAALGDRADNAARKWYMENIKGKK